MGHVKVPIRGRLHLANEMKSRINIGNACYYSLDKIVSSRLLSKKLKVKTYKTIILPVVLYSCKNWSLTLREQRLRRSRINYLKKDIWG